MEHRQVQQGAALLFSFPTPNWLIDIKMTEVRGVAGITYYYGPRTDFINIMRNESSAGDLEVGFLDAAFLNKDYKIVFDYSLPSYLALLFFLYLKRKSTVV